MLLGISLAAAALTAAASVQTAAQSFPQALPVTARGLHCPSGGRSIGDPVAKSYILQELEIDTREKVPKLVGFIYSGADGNDDIDLSPSVMRYCFSAPWDGVRTASRQ